MNFIKKTWGWLFLILAAGTFLFCYFGSPYWAVYSIKQAIDDKNQEVLVSYIDFNALITILKNQMTNQVEMKFEEKKQKPLNQVLQALSYAAVDKLVDQYVSPQGISELFSGAEKIKSMKKEIASAVNSENIQSPADKETKSSAKDSWSLNYGDNPNQFFAVIKPTQKDKDRIVVSMIREGFFSWKVNNILLPFKLN